MGRTPQTKRRRVLIIDWLADQPFYRGASSFFRERGHYQVDLHSLRTESLSWVGNVPFDGFISAPDEQVLRSLVDHGRPMVSLLAALQDRPTPHLVPDDEAIGRLGAEHLLGQGHRRFAYFGPDVDWAIRRQTGFAAKLAEHGYDCTDSSAMDRTGRLASWAAATNEKFVARWIGKLKPPVAVMAADDRLARLLANVCIAQELYVPRDMAILGVDNIDIYCEFSEPTLSSIDPGFERMGYEAGRLLDRMINGERVAPVASTVGPTGVTVRQSTANLAFADPEIVAALRFIREHALDDIVVEDICRSNAISRRHLERRFQDVLGHTPFEEIRRQRMEKAKELLVETDLSMLQIAVRCGYESASSFVTAFRGRIGCTPESYRKQHAS